MPTLLGGNQVLDGTGGTSATFITLAGAQLALPLTPTTGTGFTLVSSSEPGKFTFTSALGGVEFGGSTIYSQTPNSDLTLKSTGTGALVLSGNVQINAQRLTVTTATFNDLTVTGPAAFTSSVTDVTMASGLYITKTLEVGADTTVHGQFFAYGNTYLSPADGVVNLKPTGLGTVDIDPETTGLIDNMVIGLYTRRAAYFTNIDTNTLSVTTATVTDRLNGGSLYDSGNRVITDLSLTLGPGLSGSATRVGTTASVVLTNTGVTSIIAGSYVTVSTSTGDVTISNNANLQAVTDLGYSTTNPMDINNASPSTSTLTGALTVKGGVGIQGALYVKDLFVNGNNITTSTFNGGTITNPLNVQNTTSATSSSTGAVVILGGLGVGGNIYGNFLFDQNARVITTATIGSFGVSKIIAGTDINVSPSSGTGTVTVNDISTLQSVTDRGATTNRKITFANTSTSTNQTDGAVVVTGGVGIGANLNVGGATQFGVNNFAWLSIGDADTASQVGIASKGSYSGIDINIIPQGNAAVIIDSVKNAVSTTSAALQVLGGIGVAKDVIVGGNITIVGGAKIGDSLTNSFTSPAYYLGTPVSLDSFNITQYRTAKYLVQIVDYGQTPNFVHSAEILVTHDDNGASTQGYIVQYGLVSNYGELGTWDSIFDSGTNQLVLQFTPTYNPSNMIVKVHRTVLTV